MNFENELLHEATRQLKTIDGLKILGEVHPKIAIISFVIEGVHSFDLGTLLNEQNIAIRVGHHCAQPLLERLGYTATCRASFSFTNTLNDVHRLVDGIKAACELLRD